MNSTKIKSTSNDLIPFPVIVSAANGDSDAINFVLRHYAGYIAALLRTRHIRIRKR